MSLYEDYCLPCMMNLACGSKAIGNIRAEVVPLAKGRVLEIGVGGGLNLPFYDRDKVECICGLDPSEGMRKKAGKVLEGMDIPVELLAAPAEEIPLDDGSVDTVLITFTLCSIPDWRKALIQMRRVLKPEGSLIFCEHGLAPEEALQAWQRRINPYWKYVAGGCNLDRPISNLIKEAGFEIRALKEEYAAGLPKLAGYLYRGLACKNSFAPPL